MECELLRSPMISYRSLLYNTTVLYDRQFHMHRLLSLVITNHWPYWCNFYVPVSPLGPLTPGSPRFPLSPKHYASDQSTILV